MYRFGLGVYESEGQECYNAVMWALEVRFFIEGRQIASILSQETYPGRLPFDRLCGMVCQ